MSHIDRRGSAAVVEGENEVTCVGDEIQVVAGGCVGEGDVADRPRGVDGAVLGGGVFTGKLGGEASTVSDDT